MDKHDIEIVAMEDDSCQLEREHVHELELEEENGNNKIEPIELDDDDDDDDGSTEFTLAEVIEMEKLFKEVKSISQEFCQQLASKFSCSPHRSGKSSINWQQVQCWFTDKQRTLTAKVTSSSACKEIVAYSDARERKKRTKVTTIPACEAALELSNLTFEARSAKDYAWFDVASFLTYRILLSSGEVVVRARFSGFGKEEDEWVNVKTAVRERSIPLERSECDRVNVGDLVMCYRETEDDALYCDAHVKDIERKLHDIEGCKCIFLIQFVHDNTEEKVFVDKLCCRPMSRISKVISKPKAAEGFVSGMLKAL